MTPPETRYARSGDLRIAYQILGTGPLDLVFVPGFVSNLDLHWEMPEWADFFSRLAKFPRLILFDKRGTGLSDRVAGVANLERRPSPGPRRVARARQNRTTELSAPTRLLAAFRETDNPCP
jgi:pimeloyl-ACP methyl ester carboxylesterase